jgi:hypothetical protein
MRAAPGGYRGTGWGWRHDCPRRDPPSRWRRIARHHRAATAWLPELAKCCQNNVTRIACMYCGRGPNFRTRPIIIIKSHRNERLRTPTPSASRRKSRKPAGVSGRRIPWPRVRRRAASNFPPRRRRCVSPDRLASRARRRRLAYSGPLPPALATGFTTGQARVSVRPYLQSRLRRCAVRTAHRLFFLVLFQRSA